MKKLFFTLLTCISLISFGQAPQQISYQGVARSTTGSVLSNQNIGIKLDLHQGSAAGTVVFSETHNKTTNAFGLFTLGIGSSNASGFTAINWANGPYFLEVSMDPAGGASYTSVGTQQFMSVPYALYAQTAGNASATPTIIINAPNTVTSAGGSYTINVPASVTYTAGNGISISGNTITNTAQDQTVTITPAGSASVTGTYPNFTITTPTAQVYTAGNGIDITGGVISNTAIPVTPTLTGLGLGSASVTTSGMSFTVNTPAQQVYTAGNGIDITGGVITNTAAAVSPTINSGGVANVTNPSTNVYLVDVPAPSLNYNSGTKELTLTQNGATSTATLIGTGSSTVSIVGSGLASVTPTTGSTFTVSVPNPTLSVGSGSISISGGNSVAIPSNSTTLVQGNNVTLNQSGSTYTISAPSPTFTPNGPTTITGSYPNLTINSTASPSTTLVQGNNVVLNQSGNTYTINAVSAVTQTLLGTGISSVTTGVNTFTVNTPMPSYTQTTGILSFGGTNTIVATPSLSIVGNVLRSGPATNTVNLPAAVITGTGTGIATVTTSANTFTVAVPSPTYTSASGVLSFGGTNTVIVTPTLSLTGTTLTSGASTNSVNLATLPGLWTAPTATSVVTTNSTSLVGIGTNTPTYKLDVYANGSVPASIHGYNSGATVSSTGVFGENPNNGIGVYGQSNTGAGVWGKSTSGAGIYGESTSGDGGKFILSSNTTTANAVNAQTNGTGVALYAKSYNATPLAAKFEGGTEILHTATAANPHLNFVSPSAVYGRVKYSNTGQTNYFSTEYINDGSGLNEAFSINQFNGTNSKPVLLINGQRMTYVNALNYPLTTFHVMTSTATASGGISSEGFAQAGQINIVRNNNAGAGARSAAVFGDDLGKINFAGYDGGAFGDGAKIYAKAAENITGSNKGTELIFAAVPTGTNTNKDVFKINGANKLEILTSMIIPTGAAAGKILTSDALGNASWQTISAPASPWIQGTGIVTQSVLGDNVGIGINTPQSPLHIANAGGSQLRLGNNNQPTMEWMWNVDGTSHISLVNENNGTALTRMFMDVNTGNLGLGTTSPLGSLHLVNNLAGNVGAFVDMSATTNTDGVRVIQGGTGNGIFSGIYNASSPAKAIEAQSSGNGVVIGATSTGSGSAGAFIINNVANTSNALQVSSNGSGSSISSFNSGSGNAGYFSVSNATSTATGIQVTTTGTGNALNANANTGSAINAVSAGASATELIFNNGSGDGLQIFTGSGRGINATNTSNIVAAAQFYNDGTSNSLLATKNSTTTGGNVARIENNSSSNGADAVFVLNNGGGAGIHVNSATTSTVGLWLENGHVKATGPTVTTGSLNVGGGFTVPSFAPILTNCNDVKGTFSFTTSVTGIAAGSFIELEIKFSKPYITVPTVVATPLTDLQGLSYMVTNTTTSSFFVRVYRTANANVTLPTTIVSGSMFKFNYMVIE